MIAYYESITLVGKGGEIVVERRYQDGNMEWWWMNPQLRMYKATNPAAKKNVRMAPFKIEFETQFRSFPPNDEDVVRARGLAFEKIVRPNATN